MSIISNSNAPVTFSVSSGPGTISASTLTVTGAGQIIVSAVQASNTTFLSGTALTTIGINAPALSFAPASLAFPQTETGKSSAPQTIQVTNTGDLPAQLQTVSASAGFTVTNSCASIITAHGTCQLSVSFSPQTPGAITGQVGATASPGAYTVPVAGMAMAPPALSFAPASITFPQTETGKVSAPQTIQVTNTGDLPAQLQTVSISPGFGITNSCPGTMAAHSTCQLTVSFSSKAAGVITGEVAATGSAGTYSVPLTGAAVAPVPNLDSASVTALNSGEPNQMHLFGSNLDVVTAVQAGAFTFPITPVSPTELAVSVSPPAWATGSVSLVAITPDAKSNGLTLPLNAKPVSYDTAVRFAQQATMAVTPDQIQQIQARGLSGWIDWQLTTPMYPYESRSDMAYGTYMANTQVSQYALRQRMTLALKQIYTFGASDQCFQQECGHYWEAALQKDAFGNERDLLTDITLSPLMGNFLNNARNFMQWPFSGPGRANQNFAREVMQLMTIGPVQLNHDNSIYTDANGNTVNTYTEDSLNDMAAALSGYYMANLPQFAKVTDGNPLTPMTMLDSAHSPFAKDPLPGLHLPAGQGGVADTRSVLDALFNHSNIGPFLARRFIQHMVTSNPSPAYISRVADAFDDNGSGGRGDLAAVLRAVLLDPEARRGDDPATAVAMDSHMMEPLLYIANVMSAVGGSFSDDRVYQITNVLGQDPFMSPSVFGPYSPDNRIPSGEYAPEMQLVSDSGYMERISFINSEVKGGLPGLPSDLTQSPFYNAPDVSTLLDQMNHFLFHGMIPQAVNGALQSYVQADSSMSPNQLLPGLFTIALTSSSYQVVR